MVCRSRSVKTSIFYSNGVRHSRQCGADLDNLIHMHKIADRLFGADNYEWSVLASGRHHMPFATQSAMLGGNLRVGLEGSLLNAKGVLAYSNTEQASRIKTIIKNLGLKVATLDETQEFMPLKDSDSIGF